MQESTTNQQKLATLSAVPMQMTQNPSLNSERLNNTARSATLNNRNDNVEQQLSANNVTLEVTRNSTSSIGIEDTSTNNREAENQKQNNEQEAAKRKASDVIKVIADIMNQPTADGKKKYAQVVDNYDTTAGKSTAAVVHSRLGLTNDPDAYVTFAPEVSFDKESNLLTVSCANGQMREDIAKGVKHMINEGTWNEPVKIRQTSNSPKAQAVFKEMQKALDKAGVKYEVVANFDQAPASKLQAEKESQNTHPGQGLRAQ